jgi:hypothetical protein
MSLTVTQFWSRQIPVTALKALCRAAMGKHHLAVLEWVKAAPTVNVSAGWTMLGISTDRAIVEKHTLCELSDYYLVDLAEGLVHHPQGADRGLLTVAVQHAVSHSHHDIKLSDLMAYVPDKNLEHLYHVSSTWNVPVLTADKAARSRHFPPSRGGPVRTFWDNGGYGKHD